MKQKVGWRRRMRGWWRRICFVLWRFRVGIFYAFGIRSFTYTSECPACEQEIEIEIW